jgi:hypothetical protein
VLLGVVSSVLSYPMPRYATLKIKKHHPPHPLRACFSRERFLTEPEWVMRIMFPPEDKCQQVAVPGVGCVQPPDIPPNEGPSVISKPKGEVTRVSRGGYNLEEASKLPHQQYNEIQVCHVMRISPLKT